MISIITVVYNDLQGIKRTYESLLEYNGLKFEWVVVDGNSNDGTKEFLAETKPPFEYKYISEPDKGLYDAMNKGIALGEEEYLLFLNAGDMISKKNIIKDLPGHGEIIVFNIETVNHNLEPSPQRGFKTSTEYLKMYPSVPHQSTLIKRAVFDRIGDYSLDIRYLADYDFFCRAYVAGVDFYFVPEETFSIFVQDGISSNLKSASILKNESKRIQKKYFGKINRSWIFELTLKSFISSIPYSSKIIAISRKWIFR
ncbi:MAG: glycosyltransferase [Saprospiraceae bacterium]